MKQSKNQDPACSRFASQLTAWMEGDLAEEEALAAKQHLETCENCRVLVDTTLKTIELSRNQEKPRLSSTFKQALTARLRTELIKKFSDSVEDNKPSA
jgi:anti-sigma factor RsiW